MSTFTWQDGRAIAEEYQREHPDLLEVVALPFDVLTGLTPTTVLRWAGGTTMTDAYDCAAGRVWVHHDAAGVLEWHIHGPRDLRELLESIGGTA